MGDKKEIRSSTWLNHLIQKKEKIILDLEAINEAIERTLGGSKMRIVKGYIVRSDIPLREGRKGNESWPWAELRVGESVFVGYEGHYLDRYPEHRQFHQAIRGTTAHARTKLKYEFIVVRDEENGVPGVRVWRSK